MSLPRVNRGVPDIRVMYDIAVAKGQYSDSEQRAIESGNTSYVANENAHLWHDPKAAQAKAAAEAKATVPSATPVHDAKAADAKAHDAKAQDAKDATSATTSPVTAPKP